MSLPVSIIDIFIIDFIFQILIPMLFIVASNLVWNIYNYSQSEHFSKYKDRNQFDFQS